MVKFLKLKKKTKIGKKYKYTKGKNSNKNPSPKITTATNILETSENICVLAPAVSTIRVLVSPPAAGIPVKTELNIFPAPYAKSSFFLFYSYN